MSRRRVMGQQYYDKDAQNFIQIAGITDNVQKTAINDLVGSLKSANLWFKMIALYPFVGGTAMAHRYNLINVSEHIIAWGSASNHTVLGVIPNSSKNDLGLSMNADSISVNIYIGNHISNLAVDLGQSTADEGYGRFLCHIKYTDGNTYYDAGYSGIGGRLTTAISDTRGLLSLNRLSGVQSVYRNGVLVSERKNSLNINFTNLCLNAGYAGSTTINNARQFRFLSISSGLSASELSKLYTIVQQFQTSLNRSV